MPTRGRKDLDTWQRRREEGQRREREEARAHPQQHANEELFKAIADNAPGRVAAWLLRGADPNARGGWRPDMPPLLQAAHKDPRIIELLLERGADIHARDDRGHTALHVVGAAEALPGQVARLMDSMSGRQATGPPGIGQMTVLLDRGADVNARDNGGWTPLHMVASSGNSQDLTRVLDRAVWDRHGHPPWPQTTGPRGIEQMRLLLDRGADVNARDEHGQVPLHVAASHGNEANLGFLLARGAAIEAVDSSGWTSLHHATYYRRIEQMTALLDRGADVNARDNGGWTPLHLAAGCGEEGPLRVLLGRGAEIDARDLNGRTPLFDAATCLNIESLTSLVGSGADVSIRDAGGRTPLDRLRDLRGDQEWCKRHNTPPRALTDDNWRLLRDCLGGFTTVTVTEVRPDSLIVRIEGHHGRYPDAVREERERGGLTVPTDLVFGRDVPEPGERIRCRKGLAPVLDEEWKRQTEHALRHEAERDRGIAFDR